MPCVAMGGLQPRCPASLGGPSGSMPCITVGGPSGPTLSAQIAASSNAPSTPRPRAHSPGTHPLSRRNAFASGISSIRAIAARLSAARS
ncbi:DUF6053 domain-containing protein [Lysobacter enzymogenes]|uniref:DUF6053 domain-containing protein n=1 Tax=Lysobacter enzymogenes TaxID=69 RepID=UPI003D2F7FB4